MRSQAKCHFDGFLSTRQPTFQNVERYTNKADHTHKHFNDQGYTKNVPLDFKSIKYFQQQENTTLSLNIMIQNCCLSN